MLRVECQSGIIRLAVRYRKGSGRGRHFILGKIGLSRYPKGLAKMRTRSGTLTRQRRTVVILLALAAAFVGRRAVADAYDPPAGYFSTATGTGATLKQNLHNIIDGHTVVPYNSSTQTDLRSALQVSDSNPAQAGHML